MIPKIPAVVIALTIFSVSAGAQQSRAELLRAATSAYDDFAPERALDLAKAAVNPALGPADTAWARGVHLLAQILVEGGNQDLARTWARWAMRLAPTLAIDSVNFVAGVVTALRDARTFSAARSPGDAVARTTWTWVSRGSSEANGRLVVTQGAIPVPVNVRVVGGALVPAGGLTLPPGSYEIEAAAPGYLPARATREILPGVSTTLAFALTSAAVAADVIADNVKQRAFSNVAPLTVSRYGTAATCAAGGYLSRDGLIITSYQAIRGADNITVSGAERVSVAAYDAAADLAILHTGVARTDSLIPAANIADGQSAWGFVLASCRTPTEARVRVSQWTERPQGSLQLSAAPASAAAGTPLVDVDGRLAGVWTAEAAAVPSPAIAALLQRARTAVAQSQVITVAEMARRQNHAYGSVVVAADLPGATIRVNPLETWQWSSLQAAGAAPFTFAGPMGRYRVEATAPGGVRREQDVTVRAGASDRVMIALRTVATAPGGGQPVVRGKSRKPWIYGGVGLAGVGVALAMMGGGGSEPPQDPYGSIRIRVPNP